MKKRTDFGPGVAHCNACGYLTFNRGCKEHGLRFCKVCFDKHVLKCRTCAIQYFGEKDVCKLEARRRFIAEHVFQAVKLGAAGMRFIEKSCAHLRDLNKFSRANNLGDDFKELLVSMGCAKDAICNAIAQLQSIENHLCGMVLEKEVCTATEILPSLNIGHSETEGHLSIRETNFYFESQTEGPQPWCIGPVEWQNVRSMDKSVDEDIHLRIKDESNLYVLAGVRTSVNRFKEKGYLGDGASDGSFVDSPEDDLDVLKFRSKNEKGKVKANFIKGKSLGLWQDSGQILAVDEDSQAGRKGIKVGWRLIAVDDQECSSFDSQAFRSAYSGPGHTYALTFATEPLPGDVEYNLLASKCKAHGDAIENYAKCFGLSEDQVTVGMVKDRLDYWVKFQMFTWSSSAYDGSDLPDKREDILQQPHFQSSSESKMICDKSIPGATIEFIREAFLKQHHATGVWLQARYLMEAKGASSFCYTHWHCAGNTKSRRVEFIMPLGEDVPELLMPKSRCTRVISKTKLYDEVDALFILQDIVTPDAPFVGDSFSIQGLSCYCKDGQNGVNFKQHVGVTWRSTMKKLTAGNSVRVKAFADAEGAAEKVVEYLTEEIAESLGGRKLVEH